MPETLVIVGAGGFGREVVGVVAAINAASDQPVWELTGVIDDGPTDVNLNRLERLDVAYLGPVSNTDDLAPTSFVVGIGSPSVRRVIAEALEARGWQAATLVHPDATVGTDVELGPGTIVCPGARLTTNIRTGRHVHIDTNATVGHDSILGDYARLNPASSVSGDCSIGKGVLIGVGAAVLNQLTIGDGAIIGGAACAVRDVPAFTTVKGVPAR